MNPLYFRESHLRRVGSDSLDELELTIAKFTAANLGGMTRLSFADIGGSLELLQTLKSEYSHLLAEILKENSHQARVWHWTMPPLPHSVFWDFSPRV
jgi:hypothetical protein